MKALGSVAAVVAAIREDAAADADGIDRQTESDAALVAGADDRGPADESPGAAASVLAARDRARALLAQEDWEDTSVAMADRERWMADAAELGRQQLLEPEPADRRRDRLARLAREGLSRLPAGPVEILVAASDAPLLDPDWRAGVAAPAPADTVRVVAAPIGGGCIVRTADGRASFDNSYAARAERLQIEWRAALAEIYEQATRSLATRNPDEDPA